MDTTVAELIVRFLQQLGTTHIFGVPGAHILPVFDKLYDSKIAVILAKHEQGAAFMAGGYAACSGRVGACIATTGPGATNLVTGIANAFVNGTPVLAITGETPTYSFGRGALQESSGEGSAIDQTDIFRGITKYNKIVQRTDYLAQVLRVATNVLSSATPGPVLLSFPYNVLREKVDADVLKDVAPRGSGGRTGACGFPVEATLDLIKAARCPVVVAGHGCVLAEAEEEVLNLCHRMSEPVATSLKARDVIPEASDLCLGVLGITSKELAYRYITEVADLVLFLGVSFGERTSYNWNPKLLAGKKTIQVDIDCEQIGKLFVPDVSVCCDVRSFVYTLNQACAAGWVQPKDVSYVAAYDEKYGHSTLNDEDFSVISHLLCQLHEQFDGDITIFDDNIVCMQHFVKLKRRKRYFPNTGISSLGHAVPAAIGAKVTIGRPSVAIIGDGGFQMCCMELMTAVNHRIPVTVVLLNNSTLGLVRKNQHYNYRSRYIASDFANPDYGHLARSFGVHHRRVTSVGDADEALANLDLVNDINVIEVMMNKDGFPSYSSGR